VLELFLSEQCRLLHGRDLSGLAITSNIDPEVFEFYMKKVDMNVSYDKIKFQPDNNKIALKYASNLLTKYTTNSGEEFLLSVQQYSNHSLLDMIVLKANSSG
jgi:hypothetical protein